MARITIAAVGDLLMKASIISSAKRHGTTKYVFGPIFMRVSPYLKKHDLTIGNLETTFANGRAARRTGKYERRSRRTHFPLFNCPDELAPVLKKSGFDVLTTANNHCMDCGSAGLKRTLRILDKNRLRHTGTYRSLKESKRYLIVSRKGIKVGIIAYTMGTNSITVPKPWLVNRISLKRIYADISKLRKKTDFILVCLHFGREYKRIPSRSQKRLADAILKHGANAIVGAHPHVLQPVVTKKVKDIYGQVKTRVVAYSLGNFISTRLMNNRHTTRAMILRLTVTKNRHGKTDIAGVGRINTFVRKHKAKGKTVFTIVPRSKTR